MSALRAVIVATVLTVGGASACSQPEASCTTYVEGKVCVATNSTPGERFREDRAELLVGAGLIATAAGLGLVRRRKSTASPSPPS